jgi:hypothetical protein
MLNLQGLFGVLSAFSLVIFVPIGLIRFAIDFWSYSHASDAAQAQLNYRGLNIAGAGVFWCVVFLIASSIMEWRFRRRAGRRS